MPSGFDWDAAAKRDHARKHGSVPYWFDLPKPKSLEWRPEETKIGKALAGKARVRGAKIVAEFGRLSAAAKVASADQYRDRVRSACADERRSVPSSKERYAGVIVNVEKELLGQIKGHVKRAKAGAKPPSAAASKSALPTTILGVSVRQKHTKGKQRGKSSQVRPAPKSAAPRKTPATKAAKPPRLSDLPPIHVTARATEGQLEITWDADARVDRWMLTLLRRRNGGARAVERVALPAGTTHTALAVKMSDGPYSVRLFGIGPDGPLTRGAVDGIGSRPTVSRPGWAASASNSPKTTRRSGKARPKKAGPKGPRKKGPSKAGIKSAMQNPSAAGRSHRVRFWRGH